MSKIKSPKSYHIFTYKKQDTFVFQSVVTVMESLLEVGMDDAAVEFMMKMHQHMSKKAAQKFIDLFSVGMF